MVKTIDFSTRAVAALLSGVMLLTTTVGCGTGAGVGTTQEAEQHQAYDGQTAFRGVFFGEGPAAERLPELWGEGAARGFRNASAVPAAELATQLEAGIKAMKAEGWSDAQLAGAQQALDTLRSGGTLPDQTADAAATREIIIARLAQRDPTFFQRFATEIQSGDHLRVQRIMLETRTLTSEILRAMSGEEAGDRQRGVENRGVSSASVWKWGPVFVAVVAVVAAVAFLLVGVEPAADDSRLSNDELIDHLTNGLAVDESL
jgi:SdpC family antimicrobial peptide